MHTITRSHILPTLYLSPHALPAAPARSASRHRVPTIAASLINCHYADGSRTHCDANGQDCWRIPARLQRPGVEQTYDETAPMYESPTVSDAPPSTGRGDILDPAPPDAAVVEEDADGVPPGEQAPSGPATKQHTEPLAPVIDTTTSPDAQPVQEPVQEAGAVMAAPVEE